MVQDGVSKAQDGPTDRSPSGRSTKLDLAQRPFGNPYSHRQGRLRGDFIPRYQGGWSFYCTAQSDYRESSGVFPLVGENGCCAATSLVERGSFRRTSRTRRRSGRRWCLGADSNHRHADFQSAALPTELPRQTTRRTPRFAGAASIKEPPRQVQRALEPISN
jgi:hypothetical protein